jgi:hypothetical protein
MAALDRRPEQVRADCLACPASAVEQLVRRLPFLDPFTDMDLHLPQLSFSEHVCYLDCAGPLRAPWCRPSALDPRQGVGNHVISGSGAQQLMPPGGYHNVLAARSIRNVGNGRGLATCG